MDEPQRTWTSIRAVVRPASLGAKRHVRVPLDMSPTKLALVAPVALLTQAGVKRQALAVDALATILAGG